MYVILKKQLIKQIFTSYVEFLLRSEHTKLQQKVFSSLLVAGCTLLVQVLIRKNFFPDDTESSVRKEALKGFVGERRGGRGEVGGGRDRKSVV